MSDDIPKRDIKEAKQRLFEKMILILNRTTLPPDIKKRFIKEIVHDIHFGILKINPTLNTNLIDLQKLKQSEQSIVGNLTKGIQVFDQIRQYKDHFNKMIKKAMSEINSSFEIDDIDYLEVENNATQVKAYNNQYTFQSDVKKVRQR